jgi:L-fuconolactonase
MEPWARLIKKAAAYPNVYAKLSGLSTLADWESWSAEDIKPYIDYAFDIFGAERLLFGSDWPVANLAGDYTKVYSETIKALKGRSQAQIDAVMGETAIRFYGLGKD